MSKRLSVLVVATVALVMLALNFPMMKAARSAANEARVLAFDVKDIKGQPVSLADFKDKKAIVVVFMGTECPINNAYIPTLSALHKEYSPKGVQFLAVNSNKQDSLKKVKLHAEKYGIPFPVIKDEGSVVADQFGAKRTPETFIIGPDGSIKYQGRIDDQFGIGYKGSQPTHRDLVNALEEVLSGRSVSQPSTRVAGCIIGRASKTKAAGEITFSKQVSRILQNRCQECHREGQIGPMPLVDHDDVTAWAETIREVLSDGRMPPWYADPRYGKFSNERILPKEEKDTILAWLDAGMPAGDEKDLPLAKEYSPGWMIGKPDVILEMPEEYSVPAEMPKGGIPYKDFIVDTNFKEDKWVVAAECKPGAPEVVHHIVAFILPAGVEFSQGNPDAPVLAGTAPGDMPLRLPAGAAKKVPAGSRIVFQMHYTPNGRAQKDRSTIGLIFAKEPPKYTVMTEGALNPSFEIPAGDDNYEVETTFPFRSDVRIFGFMPHMHLRGKDFKYEAIYPDGKKEVLLSVPHFNFNWQTYFRFVEPLKLPKGSKLHCTAHFDNSTKNRNNPDATKAVTWGDQTWEEMMIGWMDFAYEKAKD